MPNNKFGIHILFPSELDEAAQLVNSSGGDWGYVTIPIQAGDRDVVKWQQFMDEARRRHIIPIIRLATEGDYFNTAVWRKPTFADVLDFGNFLGDLSWPTKNRYVVVFNEVNRDDEWGGSTNAKEYTDILTYAVEVIKTKNQDFFILSAGLDNAAANGSTAINQYDFIRQMHEHNDTIFVNVDGITSHSYPNPDFSQPPNSQRTTGIKSFNFERDLIQRLWGTNVPVFITETGWRNDKRDEDTIASFYREAFSTVWNDKNIVAVTPFLLHAGIEPFKSFSFINEDGRYTKYYQAFKDIEKQIGTPPLSPISASTVIIQAPRYSMKQFIDNPLVETNVSLVAAVTDAFYWIMKIEE